MVQTAEQAKNLFEQMRAMASKERRAKMDQVQEYMNASDYTLSLSNGSQVLTAMEQFAKKPLKKILAGEELTAEETINFRAAYTMAQDGNFSRHFFYKARKGIILDFELEESLAATFAEDLAVEEVTQPKPVVIPNFLLQQGPRLINQGAIIKMQDKISAPDSDIIILPHERNPHDDLGKFNPAAIDFSDGEIIDAEAFEIPSANDNGEATKQAARSTTFWTPMKKVAGLAAALVIGFGLSLSGLVDKGQDFAASFLETNTIETVSATTFTPEVAETITVPVNTDDGAQTIRFAFVDNGEIVQETPTPAVEPTTDGTIIADAEIVTPVVASVVPTTSTVTPVEENVQIAEASVVEPSENAEIQINTVQTVAVTIDPETGESVLVDPTETAAVNTQTVETTDTPEILAHTQITLTSLADSIIEQFNGNVPADIAEYRNQIDNVKHAFDTTAPGYAEIDANYDAMRVYQMAAAMDEHLSGQEAMNVAMTTFNMLANGDYARATELAADAVQNVEYVASTYSVTYEDQPTQLVASALPRP
jgi:hypothetical protein